MKERCIILSENYIRLMHDIDAGLSRARLGGIVGYDTRKAHETLDSMAEFVSIVGRSALLEKDKASQLQGDIRKTRGQLPAKEYLTPSVNEIVEIEGFLWDLRKIHSALAHLGIQAIVNCECKPESETSSAGNNGERVLEPLAK